MKILTESGTANLRLDSQVDFGPILDAQEIIKPQLEQFINYRIGVIFLITDIILDIDLRNSISVATIPNISIEEDTASKLSKSTAAKNNSQLIGFRGKINNNVIISLDLKNYNVNYRLPIINKLGTNGKLISRDSIISFEIYDLGFGLIKGNNHINISIDYIFEISGEPKQETLSLVYDENLLIPNS